MSELVRIDALRAQVEAVASVEEARELHAKVSALEDFKRRQLGPLDAETRALAAVRVRLERRIGQILEPIVGSGKHKQKSHDATFGRLPDGISKTQSSRWQRLAGIPDETFEDYISSAQVPSLNGALKAWRHADAGSITTATCTGDDLSALVAREQKFRTVYADPPWAYGNQGTRAATGNHYSTMSVEEICALPVEKLVDDVAQLHLWTTNAFLRESFTVIEAWGFEYKSVLVWVKPSMGIGNYWRVSHEFLLLGTRGGAAFPDDQRSHMSWLSEPRSKHSSKPEKFRALVESVSQPARLELFGRAAASGWVVWGNEVDRDLFHQSVEEYRG